jgi:hypothetical protein
VTYPTGEHYTVAVFSYDTPYAVDFLGKAEVDRDPDHVTFSYAPATDDGKLGLVHDHAYWVSRVRLADARTGDVPKGTVDVRSHARGQGDPAVIEIAQAGNGPIPYVEVGHDWTDAPKLRKENKITLTLTNVRNVRLDVLRTGIDPGRTVVLDLRTDVATRVHLAAAGEGWIVKSPAGNRVLRLR